MKKRRIFITYVEYRKEYSKNYRGHSSFVLSQLINKGRGVLQYALSYFLSLEGKVKCVPFVLIKN